MNGQLISSFLRHRVPIIVALLAVFLPSHESIGADNKTAECSKDLMLVFDASGSMATTDTARKEPHLERVKRALHRILPEIPSSRRMGLIIYGEGAYNKCDAIELKVRPQLNAGPLIVSEVDKVRPTGRTPLTQSVRDAADVLNYRHNPSVIVLLTDGEETCGGKPCDVAPMLRSEALDLTIHVIGYRHANAAGLGDVFSARCLAAETGGLYLPVESEDELTEALRKTLTCPLTASLPTGPSHVKKAEISSPSR
ncbi:MAG TPA: VWA domain-containing protein [Hyphomicrobium sp.]|nr:VWA domain-containing protein [Hyphomicrobium sp.]